MLDGDGRHFSGTYDLDAIVHTNPELAAFARFEANLRQDDLGAEYGKALIALGSADFGLVDPEGARKGIAVPLFRPGSRIYWHLRRPGAPPGVPRFEILRGGVSLGIVTYDDASSDFPWTIGWLEPTPALDPPLRALFEEQHRVLHDKARSSDSLMAIHERVMQPGIEILSLQTGEVETPVTLRIHGARVSWR